MTVAELRDLLGHDVLLLGWPTGTKGIPRKWGHLTVADMTPAYLKKLEAGNIGVALRKAPAAWWRSMWTMTSWWAFFSRRNPAYRARCKPRRRGGRVFWLRMTNSYPARTGKLKTRSGGDAGEFDEDTEARASFTAFIQTATPIRW